MKILITGGLGYIGSNIALRLLKKNHQIILLDNLSNSKINVVQNIKKLSKKKKFKFFKVDCKNKNKVFKIFKVNAPDLVIHLAGLKSVKESVIKPRLYLKENMLSATTVLDAMKKYNVNNIIFSSSATVYGKPKYLPIDEKHSTVPNNPYGLSKLRIEKFLKNFCNKNKDFSAICLRYFNPVGSDKSGKLCDNPKKPNNLFPKILKFCNGKSKFMPVYGKNYDTKDGSAIRDYIHILDLVDSHNAILKYLHKNRGFQIFNVGTGKGLTVLEIIKKFQSINKIKIKIKIKNKRSGDVPVVYASVKKINKLIGWKSKYSINKMCKL